MPLPLFVVVDNVSSGDAWVLLAVNARVAAGVRFVNANDGCNCNSASIRDTIDGPFDGRRLYLLEDGC